MLVGSLSSAATYDAPISAVSPSNVKVSSGALLLVIGVDLGTMDSTVQTRLSSSSAEVSAWKSDTAVVCKAVAGIASTLSVYVTVATAIDALSQAVSYHVPHVRSVCAFRSRYDILLSVAGENFGASLYSPRIRVGFTDSPSSQWQSDSSIACRSANFDSRREGPVVVTAGRLTGTLTSLFIDIGVAVSSIDRSNRPSSLNSHLNMLGHAFGQAAYSPATRIGNSAAARTAWISESSITCRMSATSGKSELLQVLTVRGVRGTLSSSLSHDVISLSSISAGNLRAWSPVSVSVMGAGWGHLGSSPKVRVASTDALATSWRSDTSVECHLARGYHAHPRLVATIATSRSTLSEAISYDTIEIASIFLTQALRNDRQFEATRSWRSDSTLLCNKAAAEMVTRRLLNGVVRPLDAWMRRLPPVHMEKEE
jgi:hypothetical protein